MANNSPTIVAASLSDDQLKKSIDSLVTHVDEAMKKMVTSFRRSHECTGRLSAPNSVACHHDPRLCWRLLDTHRQVWVSLLWGHCSFLLGPGAYKVL